ncbi:MAG: glutamine synthetase [Alphaproteobacteria bacterium]|nr:glutamine synthetase [Alphaproteobacteria bacterium]
MSNVSSHGRGRFADRFGLLTADQKKQNAEIIQRVKAEGLEVVRLSFADQHGILRGKTIMADDLLSAMEGGVTMTTTLLAKDTSHKTIYPVWSEGGGFGLEAMTGAGDFVMLPDSSTFRVLPWVEATGWLLCDLYFPDGETVPFSTRALLQRTVGDLAAAGYSASIGLEVEFHLFHLRDEALQPEDAGQPGKPPNVDLLAKGFQYLTEIRADQHEPIMQIIRRDVLALGLPLRSTEVEFGPSQAEVTFHPMAPVDAADTMVEFRNAVKQVCRRHGYHATFMCRPHLENMFSSGWHLHQSLSDLETGDNVFMPEGDGVMSEIGLNYIGGILEHARAASVFTTPTLNGYKRYKPFTLAPDRAVWSSDNRGAMVRAIGGAGDAGTRVENRIGEPAANPYLYIASQIASGFHGIQNQRDPGPPSATPYEADKPALPGNLMEAVSALRDSALFREEFGDDFVNYMVAIKEAEIGRFLSETNDWEHREYFDLF